MRNKKITQLLWLLMTAAIVACDRIVKGYILTNLTEGERFGSLGSVADFVYVKNTGAAFSILSGSTVLLSILSAVFCAAVIVYWFLRKDKHPLMSAALVLIFSGALGNAIDRIAYRFVIDFISIKWFDFPVFNIADIAIVLGAAAVMVYVLFFEKDKKDKRHE